MKVKTISHLGTKWLLIASLCLSGSMAASAQTFVNLWELNPPDPSGNFDTGGTQRGLTYNSLSNEVVMASRTGGNKAVIYDGDTGALKGLMNLTGVSGGATFSWNQVACADDGVLYGFNVSSTTFKIYRWASTDTNLAPTVAYGPGDPGNGFNTTNRWGDGVAIRGSGAGTEILAGTFSFNTSGITPANANTNVAIFTTTDGLNFTNTPISLPGGTFAGNTRIDVAFYTNNTFWVKQTGQPLQLYQYTITTPGNLVVATLLASVPNANVGATVISSSPVAGLLAGVNNSTPGQLRLFNLNLNPPAQITQTNFLTSNANGNNTGATVFGGVGRTNRVYALWSNNGIKAAQILWSAPATAPSISANPGGLTVYTNFPGVTFSVSASGTPPLSYQWQNNNVNITGATNATYTKTGPFTTADGGQFRVIITNVAGAATSSPAATFSVLEPLQTAVLTTLWNITNGTRSYLQNDNNARGLAYDPVTSRLVIASRTGATNAIYYLDAATGADISQLNTLGISGGTFGLNMIGVSKDGVVYAGNLTQNNADGNYILYRWGSVDSSALPAYAFNASPAPSENVRWGDSIAVRGEGNDTQVILGSNGKVVALLTTTDGGNTFTSTALAAPVSVPNSYAQLGIAFGTGNTFWTKSSGSAGAKLRHFSYDPTFTSTDLTLLAEYDLPSRITPVTGIAVSTNLNTVAAVEVGNPDNVQYYRLPLSTNPPVLLDQEFFVTDNPNGNATAALAFATNNVLYALDSNNGVKAMTINMAAALPALTITRVTTVAGTSATITWQSLPGANYDVQYKDSLTDPTWTSVGTIVASGLSTSLTDPNSAPNRFYRVVQLP